MYLHLKSSAIDSFRHSLFITVFFVLSLAFPVHAQQENLSALKVRVGYVHFDGYTEMDDQGVRAGYGYEFLQRIAPYTNFEYEYLGYDKPYVDVLKMLENGEVDILVPCHRYPQREEIYDFSDKSIGASYTILTTRESNTHYSISNPNSLEGITIGLMEENSIAGGLANYATSCGFSYTEVYYKDALSLIHALEIGEVEAIATKDLRPLKSFEMILGRFDNNDIHVAIHKGCNEIASRLNNAIDILDAEDPDWRNKIYTDNIIVEKLQNKVILSAVEEEYLEQLRKGAPLKVIISPDRAPYATYENGKPKGIFYDFFLLMANSLNLNYEFLTASSIQEYGKLTAEKVPDIIFDSPFPISISEARGYNVTEPYYKGSFAVLHRKNSTELRTVASQTGSMGSADVYRKLMGNKTVIEYPTFEQCIEAVRDGDADCCYMYLYTAAKHVSEDYSGTLEYSPVHGVYTNFRIGIKKGLDPTLYSILSKFAVSIDDDMMQDVIDRHLMTQNDSLKAYFYRNPLTFMSIVILIFITAVIIINLQLDKRKGKRQRKILEEAYEAANKANKAKTEFLANMSHDIRTPINAIKGMTHIALKNLDDKDRICDCLTKIEVSSHHLLSLVNDVLDMSKMESGNLIMAEEPVDLASLLEECLTIIQPQAKDMHVQIENDYDQQLKNPYVLNNSLHLRQVMINLSSNAIKYNKVGGKLNIYLSENKVDDDTIEYTFTFADTGIGMSPEFLDKLFLPFSQENAGSRTSYKGTGLGLSIVKMIVENMGGKISVTSEKNVGSTFVVTIPMKIDKTKNQELSKETNDDTIDISGTRILLVEDNELNIEIAKYILEDFGAVVEVAENGKIAVDRLNAQTTPNGDFDIILMDIMMPVMNGYEATQAIRASSEPLISNIPIIAMTANAFDEDRKHAKAVGMNGFVPKPIEIDTLLSEISKNHPSKGQKFI